MHERLVELVKARLDGAHDDESIADAAEALAALVRLLNRATWSQPQTAAAVAQVVGDLAVATDRMDQLLEQLSARLVDVAGSASLVDDRPGQDAELTAYAAAAVLCEARGDARRLARRRLETAHQMVAHLGGGASQDTEEGR